MSGTYMKWMRADEQSSAVLSHPSLPTPQPLPPLSGTKWSFSSTNSQTQLLQEADVISLVELNLSWRRQKLHQSTFQLTNMVEGRMVLVQFLLPHQTSRTLNF